MSIRKWLLPGLILVLLFAGGAFAPSAPEPKQPPWKLAEAKVEAARQACSALAREYQDGHATYEQFERWSRRWMDAQRGASTKRAEQLAAIEEHVKRMQDLEKVARDRVASRKAQPSEAHATEYFRIEAELMLSQFKSGK